MSYNFDPYTGAPLNQPPPPAPPAPPAKKEPSAAAKLAVILLTLLVIGGCMAIGLSSSGSKSATPGSSSSAAVSTEMGTWATKMSPVMHTLSSDTNTIVKASENQDFGELGAACAVWQTHFDDAEALLPSPDTDMNRELGAALAAYRKAATHCISGASAYDADDLMLAASEIQEGTAHITKANTIMKQYS